MDVMSDWQGFSRKVVLFTDKLIVIQDVKLLTSAHLFSTNQAGETIQVENLVSRLSHQVRRIDSFEAAAAFRAVTPAKIQHKKILD